jgi:hypothetical protein
MINKLYDIITQGKSNAKKAFAVLIDPDKIKPVEKKLLLDLRTLDVSLDNIEGLTLGAKLPDAQPSLILISDNNFNGLQQTQILAFKLKIESPLTRLLRRLKIPKF